MTQPREDCWPTFCDDWSRLLDEEPERVEHIRHVWSLPVRTDVEGKLDPAGRFLYQKCLRCGLEYAEGLDDDDDGPPPHPDTPPVWSPAEPIPEEVGA